MKTDKELREMAKVWLAPIDSVLADLMDKSERMTIGAFMVEVEKTIERIPQLYGMLDKQAFQTLLEETLSESATKSIEKNL